jgi:hypothetical protein
MKLIHTLGMTFLFIAANGLPQQAYAQQVFSYSKLCDASAAVALGADHFVVADDERNLLQIYQRGQPYPVGSLALSSFLGTKKNQESDLEGAAMIGTRIYWISSHGRNKTGKEQQRRYRFFATEVHPGPIPVLATVGKPYHHLLGDLESAEEIKTYKLANTAKLAAEAPGGLNIEGLAATPDGNLLIGFRNPVPGGSALIVPLKNPKDLISGKKAQFGLPVTLKLGGRGIRSIESDSGSGYLIVAGSPADSGNFMLYRWSGTAGEAAKVVSHVDFKNFRPEAIFSVPQNAMVQILSDDGGVKIGGKLCKDREKSKQSFRSMTIKP